MASDENLNQNWHQLSVKLTSNIKKLEYLNESIAFCGTEYSYHSSYISQKCNTPLVLYLYPIMRYHDTTPNKSAVKKQALMTSKIIISSKI